MQEEKKSPLFLIISVILVILGFAAYFILWRNPNLLGLGDLLSSIKNTNNTENFLPEVKPTEFYAPILMYHHIAQKEPQDSYYVSPEIFEQQMKWLKDNEYKVVSYDEFYKTAISLESLPQKPVVITFDDGVIDQYTNALPILKKYGYTATFFIKLNNVGPDKGGMTWEQIKDLVNSGMTIGSHSVNHDNMANMNEKNLQYELIESKKALEENLGIKINHFCYPGGAYSNQTIEALKEARYVSAATTKHQVYHKIKDINNLYKISRIHIDNEIPTFIDWVKGKNLE